MNAQLTGLTSVVISDLAITEAASALARRVRERRRTTTTARRLHGEAVRLQGASALESHAATLVTFDNRLATAATTVGLRVPRYE